MSNNRTFLIYVGVFCAFLLMTEPAKPTEYIPQLNLPSVSLVEEKADLPELHTDIELASLIFFEHTDIE